MLSIICELCVQISRKSILNWSKTIPVIFKGLADLRQSQLAFYVNLHRAVIGPSATLTGRWRPDIDLRRMLTGMVLIMFILFVLVCGIWLRILFHIVWCLSLVVGLSCFVITLLEEAGADHLASRLVICYMYCRRMFVFLRSSFRYLR